MDLVSQRTAQRAAVAPVTAIMLDRERHLKFDLEALALIEEECGINLLASSGALENLDAGQLGVILWAALTHEDPTLDPDDPAERRAAIRRVRRLIDVRNMGDVLGSVFAAFGDAMPEASEADPLESAPSRSAGSTSGGSDASTSDSPSASSGA